MLTMWAGVPELVAATLIPPSVVDCRCLVLSARLLNMWVKVLWCPGPAAVSGLLGLGLWGGAFSTFLPCSWRQQTSAWCPWSVSIGTLVFLFQWQQTCLVWIWDSKPEEFPGTSQRSRDFASILPPAAEILSTLLKFRGFPILFWIWYYWVLLLFLPWQKWIFACTPREREFVAFAF